MTRLFAGTPFDIPPECELCGRVETDCECTEAEKAADLEQKQTLANRLPPEKQRAKVRVEKRKGNRQVTVVTGLSHAANDLPDLLTRLQTACGTGGTVKAKDDLIELQGDHVTTVNETLSGIGYRT